MVQASGIKVIDALPERAMIVAATAAQVRLLGRQPWLQYAGRYSAELKSGPAAIEGHRLFQVQIANTPDTSDYVNALRARVGGFEAETRNSADLVVRIRTDLDTARALLNDPYVVAVEAYFPPMASDERQALGVTGVELLNSSMNYLNWLSVRGIERNNLTNDIWGKKIVIDIADSGIDLGCCNSVTRHQDLVGRVVYNGGSGTDFDCKWADKFRHGTVVATIAAGVPVSGQDTAEPYAGSTNGYAQKDWDAAGQFYYGLGVAPGVRLGNTRMMLSNGTATGTVDEWTRLAVTSRCNTPTDLCPANNQNAVCAATVQNHSNNEYDGVGTNAGRYTFNARDFDIRVRDANLLDGAAMTPLAVTVSAGNYHQGANDYTRMVMAAATAKNVISIGAAETHRTATPPATCTSTPEDVLRHKSESFNVLSYVSRRGTSDGRIKPDLLAPATMSYGGRSGAGGTFCAMAGSSGWQEYTGTSGTSWAAPVAAGSVALLRYYYAKNHGLTPSPAMYKAMLAAGARSIAGGLDRLESSLQGTTQTVGKWPNPQQGFGVINLTDLITPGIARGWRDQQLTLLNGQITEMTVTVSDPSKPVKIALAWTDAPAAVDASVTLVNDLDLRARGTTFEVYGNRTSTDGYSTVNPSCGRLYCTMYDGRNNVEALNISPSVFADPANRVFTVRISAPNLQGIGVPGQSGGANNQDFALFVINGTIQ